MDTTRHRRGRRARPLAAVLVAGLLVASSCGGDDDDSAASTPATSDDSTAVEATTAATTAATETTEATGSTEAPDDTAATEDTDAPLDTDASEGSSPTGATTEDGFQDVAALEGNDPDGTLTVAWQLTLATLDPLLNANVQNVAYNYPSYDALIYRDPDGELFPGAGRVVGVGRRRHDVHAAHPRRRHVPRRHARSTATWSRPTSTGCWR